jgi:HlyD family secretion protein
MRKIVPVRWLLAGALVVLVAAFFAGRAVLGASVRTVAVTRGDLTQTVVSTGRVITASRAEVGTQITGAVAAVAVEEGDRVTAGQLLAQLNDIEQLAAVAQARAAVLEAEQRVAQFGATTLPVAEQQLLQAEANLVLARNEHRRVKELYESAFYSRAALEQAERNLNTALAQQRAALKQAEAARPKGSEYGLALARLAQARAALQVAEAKLAYTRIRAPVDGLVLRRGVEPGDLVQQGARLFSLATGETQLLLNVEEKNLALLALGQRAQASPDAYPDRRFPADVFQIAPLVDAQRGTVEVKLRVPDPPDYLRIDMTVSAEITVAQRRGALVVDADAVHDAASAAPWVLAVRDGRATRVAVRLGARGTDKLEVLDGLAVGERLVPLSETAVRAGMRVRPRT